MHIYIYSLTNNNLKFKESIYYWRGILFCIIYNYFSSKFTLKGDSGGPLMCNDGGQYKFQGIVSWGIDCASKYSSWIKYVNVVIMYCDNMNMC